jgi:hypothetical protein
VGVAAVLMLCVTVLAILVAINAGFVLLEESPHASGATKDVVVLVFALLHELVDHIAAPLIVSMVAVVASAANTAGVNPSTVFVVSVAIEAVNSVLAPVIAQLGIHERGLLPRQTVFESRTRRDIGWSAILYFNSIWHRRHVHQ